MPGQMISIRDSIDELGRLEDRLEAMLTAYCEAFADVDGQLLRLYQTKLGLPKPDFLGPRRTLREEPGLRSIRWAQSAFRAGMTAVGADFESRMAGLVEMSEVVARIGRLNERLRGSAGRQEERLVGVKSGLERAAGVNSLDEMRASLTSQIGVLEKTIDEVRHENEVMLGEMEGEIAGYRRQLDEARVLAGEDPVTALPNQRRLESDVQAHLDSGVRFCLILLTPQQLALVNRQMGHEGGDALLTEVAARLKRECREEERVARWRGADFAFLMAGGLNDAIARSRVLVRTLSGEYALPGPKGLRRFAITVRYGIAESRDRDSRAELLARAESLLLGPA
ncbi:MAG: GGDEF domain-containing protein [Bryobacteraceae bacterium]|nr:GGDEF domain-containing protein [Solibacteraceae bacterium]MCO5353927.1 GGDEF domain-containing protein [Bryobacteraceae bacterium]